jgi:hypothetical protein
MTGPSLWCGESALADGGDDLQGAALAGRSARAQLPSSAIGRGPTRHRPRRPRQMAVAAGFRAGMRCGGRFSIFDAVHFDLDSPT